MTAYEVRWRFDIEDAEDMLDAARQALAVQRDPESWATIFDVREKGTEEWTAVDPQPFSDDGYCRHLYASSGLYCSKPEGHVQRGDHTHTHAGAGVSW